MDPLQRSEQPGFKAKYWIVDVAHSWVKRFRMILIRFSSEIY